MRNCQGCKCLIYEYIELKQTTFMSNVGIHIPSHSIKSSIWSKGNVYLEKISKKTVAPDFKRVHWYDFASPNECKSKYDLCEWNPSPQKRLPRYTIAPLTMVPDDIGDDGSKWKQHDLGSWEIVGKNRESNCHIQDMSHDYATVPKWDFMTQVEWARNACIIIYD